MASPPRGGVCTIKLPAEPVLDGVLEEDRPTVRNVIYVLHALKLCQSWSVTAKNQGYEVVGSVDTRVNSTIESRDLELIRKVEGNEEAEPCFGVTFPLLLKADGRKFGKSEDGAIWLAAGA